MVKSSGPWRGEAGQYLTGSLNFTENTMRSAAPGMLLASGIIQYLGASIAVALFAAATVSAVAWGRVAVGALVMMAWRRPAIKARQLWVPAVYGLALVTMNMLFYQAIARIPLGTAVALEFLGPVILAAVTGRGWRIWGGIIFALTGVFMISWVGVDLRAPGVAMGVACAVAAGIAWAVYMWLASKAARAGTGPDSLAIGMAIGTLAYAWVAIPTFGVILSDLKLLGLIVAVGLFSSVVPYVLEVLIVSKIPAGNFALLNALYPATSLVVGMILLRQIPTLGELGGLLLISVAVVLVSLRPRGKRGVSGRELGRRGSGAQL